MEHSPLANEISTLIFLGAAFSAAGLVGETLALRLGNRASRTWAGLIKFLCTIPALAVGAWTLAVAKALPEAPAATLGGLALGAVVPCVIWFDESLLPFRQAGESPPLRWQEWAVPSLLAGFTLSHLGFWEQAPMVGLGVLDALTGFAGAAVFALCTYLSGQTQCNRSNS